MTEYKAHNTEPQSMTKKSWQAYLFIYFFYIFFDKLSSRSEKEVLVNVRNI